MRDIDMQCRQRVLLIATSPCIVHVNVNVKIMMQLLKYLQT